MANGWRMIQPFDDKKIREIVGPYMERALPVEDAEAQALSIVATRQARKIACKAALKHLLYLRRARSPEGVMNDYDGLYGQGIATLERGLARDGKSNTFRFADSQLLLMRTGGLYAAYLAAIDQAIEALQPGSVREIGFGSGKNLFYLAQRYPEIELSGFELTPQGAALAQALQQEETLPPNLSFLVNRDNGIDMARMGKIDFRQGNACDLAAEDKSADLAFTMLALEQMWSILPQALSEIRRTTRRHVVFIEAFREGNDFSGRLNLWSRNYFRASLDQMRAAGFKPLELFNTLPSKFTFSATMLIAEVM